MNTTLVVGSSSTSSESSMFCRNTRTINNDDNRVSPTSILDFPSCRRNHNEYFKGSENETFCSLNADGDTDYNNGNSNILPAHDDVTYTEFKELEHPLARKGSSNTGVAFNRSCTPRDYDVMYQNNNTNMLRPLVVSGSSDEDDVEMNISIGLNQIFHEIGALPTPLPPCHSRTSLINNSMDLRPLRTRIWSSSSSNNNGHNILIEEVIFKKQAKPTFPEPKVSFNDMVEVRFFYRSDDEIAIMQQCALERRKQHEASIKRRRRRQARKKDQLFHLFSIKSNLHDSLFMCSSNHIQETFMSMFSRSWTTNRHETFGESNINEKVDDKEVRSVDDTIHNCDNRLGCFGNNYDDVDFVIRNDDHPTYSRDVRANPLNWEKCTFYTQSPNIGKL